MKEFKALDRKNKKEQGTFYVDYVKLETRPQFLDYIRGGTQLALICSIDFTASNIDPSSPR